MIANLPTGWLGRALALSLTCVVLSVVYVALAAPLLNLYSERAMRAETRRSLLLKLTAVASELPALRACVAELSAAVDSSRLTLEGTTDAITLALFQGHIVMSAAADITIRSTESLPAEVQGDYRRIGLRLFISGPYESLVHLLAGIETAPPIIVRNVQIRSVLRRPGTAPFSAIDASLEVLGFRAEETAAVAKP